MSTTKASRKPREQGTSDKPKNSRTRTKITDQPAEDSSEAAEKETIIGNVNEPGSGRHEAPPVHGGEGATEWPR